MGRVYKWKFCPFIYLFVCPPTPQSTGPPMNRIILRTLLAQFGLIIIPTSHQTPYFDIVDTELVNMDMVDIDIVVMDMVDMDIED